MVQFFFGTLRNKSELIVDVKSEQERGKCFPTRTEHSFYNIVITVSPISRQYIGKCELSRQS